METNGETKLKITLKFKDYEEKMNQKMNNIDEIIDEIIREKEVIRNNWESKTSESYLGKYEKVEISLKGIKEANLKIRKHLQRVEAAYSSMDRNMASKLEQSTTNITINNI